MWRTPCSTAEGSLWQTSTVTARQTSSTGTGMDRIACTCRWITANKSSRWVWGCFLVILVSYANKCWYVYKDLFYQCRMESIIKLRLMVWCAKSAHLKHVQPPKSSLSDLCETTVLCSNMDHFLLPGTFVRGLPRAKYGYSRSITSTSISAGTQNGHVCTRGYRAQARLGLEQCECKTVGDWEGGTVVLWHGMEQLGQEWLHH